MSGKNPFPILPPRASAAALSEALQIPPAFPGGPVPPVRVISWNLTRHCNWKCDHCYIDAGPEPSGGDAELPTGECLRILDQIAQTGATPLLILTGGEPLLRRDLGEIARRATDRGFFVVVGTNGTLLRSPKLSELRDAGVRGVSFSIHSDVAEEHDGFTGRRGSWEAAVEAAASCRAESLDFLVQATCRPWSYRKVDALADFAGGLGALAFNLYLLVATGRGAGGPEPLTPDQNELALADLRSAQKRWAGRMIVNAKCGPHFKRILWEDDPRSPFLRGYASGCPAGVHYCQITPDGRLTPCPYMALTVGDLRSQSFGDIWEKAPVLQHLRSAALEGRCGRCEFKSACGGCRCRAYAETGNYLAEDPACRYQPAGLPPVELDAGQTYGVLESFEMPWTAEARQRIQAIPSFARGMVVRRVQDFARQRGVASVDGEVLTAAREAFFQARGGQVPFKRSSC